MSFLNIKNQIMNASYKQSVNSITRDSRRCYFCIIINCINNSDIIINCKIMNT